MCDKTVDCQFCAKIETCGMVAAAFPTRAELAEQKRGYHPGKCCRRLPNGKTCGKATSTRKQRYCRECNRARRIQVVSKYD